MDITLRLNGPTDQLLLPVHINQEQDFLDHSFVLTDRQVVGQNKVGQFVIDRRLGRGDLGKAVVVWTSTLWGPVLIFDLEEVFF